MPLTDDQFQQWLEQSASSERCLLIALESDEGLIRIGWPAFINRPFDTYPNLFWDDVLSELPEFSASEGVIDIGDIEIVWPDQVNELFSRYWRGRRYRMWLGSQSWPMDDFKVISSGLIEQVERTAAHRIRFHFSGLGVLLDKSIEASEDIPANRISLSYLSSNNPRDFDPQNSSVVLPLRYTWQQPDVLFKLPEGEDAWRPEL